MESVINEIEFDFEQNSCVDPLAPITSKTTNGARLLTRSGPTDHGLLDLEILDLAEILDVSYLGFDRTLTTSSTTTGIHHPWGDAKKISFDYDPPGSLETQWVIDWDLGITEEGSSGSPLLLSSNNLVVGHLISGNSDCSTSGPDFYPKLGYYWDKKDDRFLFAMDRFIDYFSTDPVTLQSYFPASG